MGRPLSSAVYATALLLSGVSLTALVPPAQAAVSVQFGFNFFHDRLSPYGRWIHHPLWGDVWRPRPRLVGADFQPYTNGHWELTDEYGWYWVSDDPFDDVVYHYGRWVYDPQFGWLWVPGYTWAPAWVSWRESDDYTGWMPLPPDQYFLSGGGFSFGVDLGPIGIDFYRRWYGERVNPERFFVFVDNRHLVERDYLRFRVPRERVVTIINRTRPVTRFEVVNNRVVNRGIDVKVVERATGRRIAPVSAKVVIKPNAVITTVNEAKEIRQRERAQHPIEAERRGPGAGQGNEKGNAAETGAAPGGNGAEQGNPATGETGKNRGGKKGAAETPEAGNNAGGPEQGNPATGETGKKKGKKGEAESAAPGGSMTGPSPNTTGAGPAPGNENEPGATPKRRKNTGSMNGPASDETGQGSNAGANGGTNESSPPPRRQRNNGTAGSMGGGMNMSGPGSNNAQTGAASRGNGPNASSSSMSSGQNAPANGEQPKKKKKPKNTNEEQPNSPEQ